MSSRMIRGPTGPFQIISYHDLMGAERLLQRKTQSADSLDSGSIKPNQYCGSLMKFSRILTELAVGYCLLKARYCSGTFTDCY